MNLNKVFLIGRLAADPEMRTTPTGQSVVTLRIATNRVWNNRTTNEKQEQTEFHTVIAWGRLAEIAQKYLLKGQLAFFEGRLQTRNWQGADGVKRYRTEIVAENLQLGPKSAGSSNYPNKNQYQAPVTGTDSKPNSNFGATPGKISGEIKEDDIPIIDAEAPVSNPVISDDEIEEAEIDLKDIPF